MDRQNYSLERMHSLRPCTGFTLIEVMIAMVVLAIGLVSVAMLQARSLQASHASFQQSVVAVMAHDLVERLWASVCVPEEELEDHLDDILEEWEAAHPVVDGSLLPGWGHDVTYDEASSTYTMQITWANRLESRSFQYFAQVPVIDCES